MDTKNQAESMIYQTEKQLKEFESKVPADVKVWTNMGRVWCVLCGQPWAGRHCSM